MIITPVQIVAGLIGLLNIALYFFYWDDQLQQVENLLWFFITVVVFLHDDLLINLFHGEEDDKDPS